MRRTREGQWVRKYHGIKSEELVKGLLQKDRKLKGWEVTFEKSNGSNAEGIDVLAYPPICAVNPDSPSCRPIEFEVKQVEKLYELDERRPWPHNRDSRFVLKKSEKPHCYVLVTEDEITNHTVVDIVESGRIHRWMSRITGKRPKLPVRAIPLLRKTPCPYVSVSHYVTGKK